MPLDIIATSTKDTRSPLAQICPTQLASDRLQFHSFCCAGTLALKYLSQNYTSIDLSSDCARCFFGLFTLSYYILLLILFACAFGSLHLDLQVVPSQKSPPLADVHNCKRKPLQVNLFGFPVAFQPKHGKTTRSRFPTLRNHGWVLQTAPKPGNPTSFNSGPPTILAERMTTHRQDHLHPTEKTALHHLTCRLNP